MQDQYAGDIGDYVKLALLRELGAGKQVGVAWYMTPDERQKNDGRHIDYLAGDRQAEWRCFDPELYEKLARIVKGGRRTVAALEEGLIGECVKYYSAPLSDPKGRRAWFERLKADLTDCDLIFLDPDNGIEPAGFKPQSKKSIKSVTYEEIRALVKPQRPMVIYHHHTRFKGGHDAEIAYLGNKLAKMDIGCVCAVRARMWSPRVFFVVGGLIDTWSAAERFAAKWAPHVQFYGIKGPPDELGMSPDNPYSVWAEKRLEKSADLMRFGAYDHLFKKSKLSSK